MSYDSVNEREYYEETDGSMIKLNAPISRSKFFIYFLFYLLWGVGTVAAKVLFGALLFPVIIISIIGLIYIQFIISTSRLWDITANKKLSVIISIVFIVLCAVKPLAFLQILYLLFLLFTPGKLVKS